ncbi:hypothetical protein EVAR_95376_1 [Eumeta japonica]|uniref:Uncharacterized protein n=1 Tax=Eumeta variegata TaxID=151549 RepID=A0A4C1U9A0_EUMVA|nr:hypothetical protein EVAR_95376_1 [Eumeta japonica]
MISIHQPAMDQRGGGDAADWSDSNQTMFNFHLDEIKTNNLKHIQLCIEEACRSDGDKGQGMGGVVCRVRGGRQKSGKKSGVGRGSHNKSARNIALADLHQQAYIYCTGLSSSCPDRNNNYYEQRGDDSRMWEVAHYHITSLTS